MSLSNRGIKWKLKNSLFLIFAFIPFINCIPFFHMYNKVKLKKWKIMAWVVLVMQLLLMFILILTAGANNPIKVDTTNKPKLENYLGYNYSYKYTYSEYTLLPEYEQYLKDLDKWESQPEIAAQLDEYGQWYSRNESIGVSLILGMMLFNIFVIFLASAQIARYLELLDQKENIHEISNNMRKRNKRINQKTINSERRHIENNKNNSNNKININLADEETLSNLPGITIIDAKKAIEYRQEHSGFKNIDEFFSCINAKPHVIVNIQDSLMVDSYNRNYGQDPEKSGKRKIDL